MDELTQKHINEFIKPNFYLMQNVITFLLPGRRKQFDFYSELIANSKKNLSFGAPIKRVQHLVAWEALQIERIFLTYLLSEEMGTYFDAMARFPGGDFAGSVMSKKSYTFSHNFYQLAKKKYSDFFSHLMMYPYNAELKQLYNMPENAETDKLIKKVINLSCVYLWDKKEVIKGFRKRHKTLFNSYKHGMSILYNMKTTVKINMASGQEVNAFTDGPLVLNVKINENKRSRKDQWLQEILEPLDESVTECFNLIIGIFDMVVRERLKFTHAILQACKYDATSGNYIPYKRPNGELRFFGLSQCSSEEINTLKKIFNFQIDDHQ